MTNGAIVGDNPKAQEIYDRLSSGNPLFGPSVVGNPPVGGSNVPSTSEIPKAPDPQTPSTNKGFPRLIEEIVGLRKDIQELKVLLSGL